MLSKHNDTFDSWLHVGRLSVHVNGRTPQLEAPGHLRHAGLPAHTLTHARAAPRSAPPPVSRGFLPTRSSPFVRPPHFPLQFEPRSDPAPLPRFGRGATASRLGTPVGSGGAVRSVRQRPRLRFGRSVQYQSKIV